jgi:hypothetical protein
VVAWSAPTVASFGASAAAVSALSCAGCTPVACCETLTSVTSCTGQNDYCDGNQAKYDFCLCGQTTEGACACVSDFIGDACTSKADCSGGAVCAGFCGGTFCTHPCSGPTQQHTGRRGTVPA